MRHIFPIILLFSFLGSSVLAAEKNLPKPDDPKAQWLVLFDGTSTKEFKSFRSDTFPEKGWGIEDGCLKCQKSNGRPNGGGGDIVTKRSFGDFDLYWEWKIAPKGNSGVIYFARKREKMTNPLYGGDDGSMWVGHEYQIIDPAGYSKSKPNEMTASFYQIVAPKGAVQKPVDEFNSSRIVVLGDHVQHWLNGVKVLEYTLGGEEILKKISESKYRDVRKFGKKVVTPIKFQDHGTEVWYRNIRVRDPK